jgi:hypothetical protein
VPTSYANYRCAATNADEAIRAADAADALNNLLHDVRWNGVEITTYSGAVVNANEIIVKLADHLRAEGEKQASSAAGFARADGMLR